MLSYLSSSLIKLLLTEWIDIKGKARLDSAYCESNYRDEYLQLLQSHMLPELNFKQCSVVRWIVLRKLKSVHINIDGGSPLADSPYFQKFVAVNGSMIRSISMRWCVSSLQKIISCSCRQLTSLRCCIQHVDSFIQLLKSNPYLKSLIVEIDHCVSRWSGGAVARLPELTLLRVFGYVSNIDALLEITERLQKLTIYGSHTPEMISCNTALMSLRSLQLKYLYTTDAQLAIIVPCVPFLVNLEISYCYALTDKGVLIVAQNLPHLRTLCFLGCSNLTDQSLQYLSYHLSGTLELIQLCVSTCFTHAGVASLRARCKHATVQLVATLHYQSPERLECILNQAMVNIVVVNFQRFLQANINISCNSVHTLHLTVPVPTEGGRRLALIPSIPAQGFVELCVNWPNLRTIIVHPQHLSVMRACARELPQLTITTDASIYVYDLLSMPV